MEGYAGAHPDAFRELLDQAKVIVPTAVSYITGRWGLSPELRHPLVVTITEGAASDPEKMSLAHVRAVWRGAELRQELVLHLDRYLQYPNEDLENVLTHEVAHAVLQDAVVGPEAAGIPRWFHEGLAQSITSEGRQRTQADFNRYGRTDARAVICDLNGQVDAFFHGESNFGCYTYFYLAVQHLLARSKPDAIPTLIRGLNSGTPLTTLISTVTSLDWPAFQRATEQYTRRVFAGEVPIP